MTAEVLQQFDFSQGPLGQDLLAENIGDLLDSDTITRHGVICGTREIALSALNS